MSLQCDPITGELFIPAVRKPRGYCVHKYTIKKGMLSKLELFAYFEDEALSKILERTEVLGTPKKGLRYPPYFNHYGKHTILHRAIVMWNKSPVLIKCYKAKGNPIFKLEVTRGTVKNVGKKFLQPVSTLNSLGSLINFLTFGTEPISNIFHSDFLYIDEFISECRKEFIKFNRNGQLRLMMEQKSQINLKFGLDGS